jgi:pyridoxamine 5'-phosphate oxidase
MRAADRAGPVRQNAGMRREHPLLRRAELADDPFAQFAEWYELAREEVPLAEAMTLASADAEGAPDARMVLLKGHGRDGFRFFSNLESAKAAQLAAEPRAALAIYWREHDRQVRVRGTIERLDEAASDEYFASRPRASRLGAWASPQSRPLADRAALEELLAETESRFAERQQVPRPDYWGGYLLRPRTIEFWQGQQARLHDRFLYTREADGSWRLERLAP